MSDDHTHKLGIRWRFIHIPRNGGLSVASAYGRGTEGGHQHLPASCYPDRAIRLVALIRDPTERAVSLCAHLLAVKNRPLTTADFRDWVADGCPANFEQGEISSFTWRGPSGLRITHPQIAWLNGRVDLLLFERAPRDLAGYMKSLGRRAVQLPTLNPSQRLRPASLYLDHPTAARLRDIYHEDYELWERLERRGSRRCF